MIGIRSAGERAPAPLPAVPLLIPATTSLREAALSAVSAWIIGLEIFAEHCHHTPTTRQKWKGLSACTGAAVNSTGERKTTEFVRDVMRKGACLSHSLVHPCSRKKKRSVEKAEKRLRASCSLLLTFPVFILYCFERHLVNRKKRRPMIIKSLSAPEEENGHVG